MCWTSSDQRVQDAIEAWDLLCEACKQKADEKLIREGKDSLFDFEAEEYGFCDECMKRINGDVMEHVHFLHKWIEERSRDLPNEEDAKNALFKIMEVMR
jgi:hypothetical protein